MDKNEMKKQAYAKWQELVEILRECEPRTNFISASWFEDGANNIRVAFVEDGETKPEDFKDVDVWWGGDFGEGYGRFDFE